MLWSVPSHDNTFERQLAGAAKGFLGVMLDFRCMLRCFRAYFELTLLLSTAYTTWGVTGKKEMFAAHRMSGQEGCYTEIVSL